MVDLRDNVRELRKKLAGAENNLEKDKNKKVGAQAFEFESKYKTVKA